MKVYEDAGISGTKGRDKRSAFDAMLKAAVRRDFDIVAVWSTDRLGRSMAHLIDVLTTIRETGRDVYAIGPYDVRHVGPIRRVRT